MIKRVNKIITSIKHHIQSLRQFFVGATLAVARKYDTPVIARKSRLNFLIYYVTTWQSRRNFKKAFFLFLSLIFFFFFSFSIQAQNTPGDIQNKIDQYTEKLIQLSKEKDTLSNQINYLNSQVQLTSLKISQIEQSIEILKKEIIELTQEINKLDVDLNKLSSLFLSQVNENYKISKKIPSISIFSSKSFNHFFEQYKYIQVLQKANQQTMLNLETVRTNYDIQKQKKEQKQEELANLQETLDRQKKELIGQKAAKDNLLAITKNDEKTYQKLKSEAEQELSALLKAKFVGKRQVSKGEPLGIMGNTGFSLPPPSPTCPDCGTHLHFGLYQLKEENLSVWSYFNDIDAQEYINQYGWPLNNPFEITQGRGVTKYAYLYSDKFHHGIDLVSSNRTILAINEGVAYFFRNPSSSLGNHVKLFHPDGKMTLYLHMQ
ncbi:hypothetical protein KKC08_00010 [Patescibacteria group bacterium]|nr:hypothetical protein [Patescibacteria group bacterium]MCG2701941.1 hypothetical protein [Candidatus Parcubacteria bacterium]MBU4265164.1 hypothetical protein [Patescibacteria group bacterium]MBU4390728.1 hypothetical protein [Patescibacteria group bacterium]MBU4396537.1 hypothetical protein [Patescibacteria group bacterium]